MTVHDLAPMASYWHEEYFAAARKVAPELTKGADLAVGWKVTRPDGTTHGGYFWPLVKRGLVAPAIHEASNWSTFNTGSCPSREGDGLCLIAAPEGVSEATSGPVRSLSEATMRVLVYDRHLARGDTPGKRRVPWVIDVDSCVFTDLAINGLVAYLAGADLAGANLAGAYLARANLAGAYLAGADLTRANLTRANLARANLAGAYLAGANLARADLTRANLARANLTRANLAGAYLAGAYLAGAYADRWTLWPTGFVVPSSVVVR